MDIKRKNAQLMQMPLHSKKMKCVSAFYNLSWRSVILYHKIIISRVSFINNSIAIDITCSSDSNLNLNKHITVLYLKPLSNTQSCSGSWVLLTHQDKIATHAEWIEKFYLFIYLLGANQNEHMWQMVCKEMWDQYIQHMDPKRFCSNIESKSSN